MINSLIEILGYSSVDQLPYFSENLIILFILTTLFFGALAFFDAILKIIFSIIPRR